MDIPPLARTFVLHFGEMGRRWGINRTVGQIYALLFISSQPLNAEEISAALGLSRSNISMGLKELQSWRLVRLQHIPGDRREYFTTPEDVWEIVRILAEERRKREVDPTLTLLRDVLMQSTDNPQEQYAQERMRELHELIELLTGWADDVQKLETERLVQLMKLGSRITRLLDFKDRLTLLPGGKARRRKADDATEA